MFIWVARPLPEEEDIQLDGELFTGSSGDGAPGKLQVYSAPKMYL